MKISDNTGAILTLASINDGKASEGEADSYPLCYRCTYAYTFEVPLESPDLLIQLLQRVGGPDLAPVGVGEVGVGGEVGLCVQQQLGDGRELGGEHVGDDVDVVPDGVGVGWADIVRMIAATISAPLPTRARALRMKLRIKWTGSAAGRSR